MRSKRTTFSRNRDQLKVRRPESGNILHYNRTFERHTGSMHISDALNKNRGIHLCTTEIDSLNAQRGRGWDNRIWRVFVCLRRTRFSSACHCRAMLRPMNRSKYEEIVSFRGQKRSTSRRSGGDDENNERRSTRSQYPRDISCRRVARPRPRRYRVAAKRALCDGGFRFRILLDRRTGFALSTRC